ncbi:MAG TPA: hypothetical protein O0X70_00330 [Methanocorpusculum sp.]|nr:hypothetical protein [Methanocorpusculum sp.]
MSGITSVPADNDPTAQRRDCSCQKCLQLFEDCHAMEHELY